jgi:hypothetical protein
MNLESWLKQPRPVSEILWVIEALSAALNDAHARGVVHPALEPSNVDLLPEGGVSLAEAIHGVPSRGATRYRAPEVLEGGSPSAPADIFAAGVIFYEMLSGKSPAQDRPTPLGELRADLSRDLTDAVMGCLDKGPDWRPKDLSYLAQVVAENRGSNPPSKPQVTKASRAEAGRQASAPAPAAPRQPKIPGARQSASRSQVPLIAGVMAVLVLASVGGWFWLQSQKQGPSQAEGPRPAVTPPPATAPTPSPTAAAATPQPTVPGVATPKPTPTPAPTAAVPAATPTPAAIAVPTPLATRPPPPPTSSTPASSGNPPAGTQATPAPPSGPAATQPAAPTPAPPPVVEAALLSAVTPLSVKRPTTTMLDVRGSSLRSDHRVRFFKAGAPVGGITVKAQKWVNASLITVLVQIDESVSAGPYSVAVLDGEGQVSNLLTLTVTK